MARSLRYEGLQVRAVTVRAFVRPNIVEPTKVLFASGAEAQIGDSGQFSRYISSLN